MHSHSLRTHFRVRKIKRVGNHQSPSDYIGGKAYALPSTTNTFLGTRAAHHLFHGDGVRGSEKENDMNKFFLDGRKIAALEAARNNITALRAVMLEIKKISGGRNIISPILRGGFLPGVLREEGVEILPKKEFLKASEDAFKRRTGQTGKTARDRESGAKARQRANHARRAEENRARASA